MRDFWHFGDYRATHSILCQNQTFPLDVWGDLVVLLVKMNRCLEQYGRCHWPSAVILKRWLSMYKGNKLNAKMAWERIWFWNLDSFGVCSFFWETNIAPSQPRFEEDFPWDLLAPCTVWFLSGGLVDGQSSKMMVFQQFWNLVKYEYSYYSSNLKGKPFAKK